MDAFKTDAIEKCKVKNILNNSKVSFEVCDQSGALPNEEEVRILLKRKFSIG